MNSNGALREVFVGHVPKLRKIVSRIVKQEGIVDDIAQEACIRIIEKEKRLRLKMLLYLEL